MVRVAFVKLPWVMQEDTKRRPSGKLFNFLGEAFHTNALPVLASFLLQHGYNISLHSLKRPEEIVDIEADVYCFSLRTVDVPSFLRVRQFMTNGRIILGGHHASFDMSLLQYCDTIVIGEGELGLLQALSDLKKNRLQRIYNEPCIEELDSLPRPAWEMSQSPNDVTMIISSRGCPFHCTFCCVSRLYNHKWRAMSPKRIMHEINENKEKFVVFLDDNFTLSTKRVREFLSLKKEMGVNFAWFCESRTDTIVKDPKLFESMAEEGCKLIFLGIESANDEILKDVRKGTTNQMNRKAVETLHECGIGVWTSVMIGPYDNEKTSQQLGDFCVWAEPLLHSTSITTPFIGTDLFDEMEKSGRLLHKKWELYDGGHCVFQPDELSPTQIESISLQVDDAVWETIGWHKYFLKFPKLLKKPLWNFIKPLTRFIK